METSKGGVNSSKLIQELSQGNKLPNFSRILFHFNVKPTNIFCT